MNPKHPFLCLLLLCPLAPVQAQQSGDEHAPHQHAPPPAQERPNPPQPQKKQEAPPPQKPPQAPPAEHQQQGMAGMDMSAKPPREPHRMASGTAWQPDSTPAYMWMTDKGKWTLMAHGNLFLTFNHQGGPRGAGKAESMNWAMFMEQHPLGRGTLEFRQMFSAEALTAPHPGFPQLFQTGETYRGQPLVDHQHPHDVFGELSVMYSVPLTMDRKWSWHVYGGAVGEPALGPVAFMHRGSAAEIPAPPLGHHLQDSTHITAGVVTTGLTWGKVGGEVSVFNGREPDQVRQTIDFGPLDSWSARLSVRPSKNWTAQYSYGRLHDQEIHAGEPGDTDRQTASVSYNRPFARGNWATSVIWGRNHKRQENTTQNGYLLESIVNFKAKNYAYTRLELADKDELFPATPPPHPQFRIGAYTFGGVRDLVQSSKLQMGLGADVTFYSKPAALDPVYGENPVSFRVFLRLRPGRMEHHH